MNPKPKYQHRRAPSTPAFPAAAAASTTGRKKLGKKTSATIRLLVVLGACCIVAQFFFNASIGTKVFSGSPRHINTSFEVHQSRRREFVRDFSNVEHARLKERVDKFQGQNDKLRKESESLREELRSATKKLASLNLKNNELQEGAKKKGGNYQSENDKLRKESDSLREELRLTTGKLASLKLKNDELREEMKKKGDTKGKNDKGGAGGEGGDIKKHKLENDALRREANELRAKLKDLDDRARRGDDARHVNANHDALRAGDRRRSKGTHPYARSVAEILPSPPRPHVPDFERQDDVVIVTKIHGRQSLITLEQSLCLLHFAYNRRMNYDVVVFYTDDLDDRDMAAVRRLVSPARASFVRDSPPLQEALRALPPERLENLMSRCREKNATIRVQDVDWWTYCPGRINYNWQVEFRAWHIWRQPVLARYKYMLWVNSDVFPTREWTRDPVAYAINNDLVVFAGAYGGGKFGGKEMQGRVHRSFNTTICSGKDSRERGHVVAETGDDCFNRKLAVVNGYLHLTNLDFFRSDVVENWARNWIGDCYLCREHDDQAAVTVPALVLAPEKTWTMDTHNFSLGVFHNNGLDGKKAGGFIKLWNHGHNNMTVTLDEARGVCPIRASN